MVTIVSVPAEGVVPRAFFPAGSSQDVSSKGGVYRHHPHHEHRGRSEGHRSVGARIGRRHHHHHHRRFHHWPYNFGVAHRHGHGDFAHHHGGRMMFHDSPHRGPRGRHCFFRGGLQDIPPHGHGPHRRGRRMHRSLSPHHLMHDGSGDGGARGPPLRGHREHGGGMGSDDNFCRFCGRDFSRTYGQDLFPGAPLRHAAPQQQQPPALAIEEGIEQFGQLSLTS